MATYHPNVVVSDDGTIIPLKHIETMNFVRTDEDAVVDKLRDDCAINIVTLSGQEFLISIEMQLRTFPKEVYGSPEEISTEIYDKWIRSFN